MDGAAGDRGWFDHLSDGDLDLLGRVASRAGVAPVEVRSDPGALARVLSHPAAFEAVFSARDDDRMLSISPFLTFALVVHRGWVELQGATHVDEWVGARQRLPVLGGDDLRAFLAAPQRRLFLNELLASYTRVASGSTLVRTRRGWRRRRFSELDPLRLASLLETLPEAERAGLYRRLGDLALFLTGVFPDHTEVHALSPLDELRLRGMSGLAMEPPLRPDHDHLRAGGVGVLEGLGQAWYRLAARTAGRPLTGTMVVVEELGERFGVARRTLNYLTDRHLFARRNLWFGDPTP